MISNMDIMTNWVKTAPMPYHDIIMKNLRWCMVSYLSNDLIKYIAQPYEESEMLESV